MSFTFGSALAFVLIVLSWIFLIGTIIIYEQRLGLTTFDKTNIVQWVESLCSYALRAMALSTTILLYHEFTQRQSMDA